MDSLAIEEIEIDQIYILNPRERNKAKFQNVVESIASVGLKRPIKVSRATAKSTKKPFVLICGQGRLEAFKILGESKIPAVVVTLSNEECYIQSLIENLARRTPTTLETVNEIGALSERGFSAADIAVKTGLGHDYVSGLVRLLKKGEQRLLAAVERGDIPISIAVEIASTPDHETQAALNQAYARKELRGTKLKLAIRLVNDRERWGKSLTLDRKWPRKPLTSQAMVNHYKRETERQRNLITRANLTEARLAIIKAALRELFKDEHFATLLRAEGLDTLPTQIASYLLQEAETDEL